MILGDLGADVIKVERPTAATTRASWGPPFAADGATYYLAVNRNKRSIALDLRTPATGAGARARRRADVIVETFRPGHVRAPRPRHDESRADNPGLVSARSPHSAPASGAAAARYDLLMQAMGGLMSVTGAAGGRRARSARRWSTCCGLWRPSASCRAARAERNGRGQRVEVSLMDRRCCRCSSTRARGASTRASCRARGNRHPSIAPYETFAAADGDLASRRQRPPFARLCDALGRRRARRPTSASRPTRRAWTHRDALAAALERRGCAAAARPTGRSGAATIGVPGGPVNDVARGVRVRRRLGWRPSSRWTAAVARSPPDRPRRDAGGYRRPPPALGAHGEAIRAWLASPSPPRSRLRSPELASIEAVTALADLPLIASGRSARSTTSVTRC